MAATNGQFWTQQFLKPTGLPYVGVRVFHYEAGNTTTNLDVFQDAAMASAHNNPVVGDASGRVSFYGSGTYRLLIKSSTADGNLTLYDWDPVELVHHTATVRAEDKAISLPAATSAARGRLFGVTDAGGDVLSLWIQKTAAQWQAILTLPTLSQMIQFAKGTDIASTTSVTIPTDGNFFDITGENAIEGFSSFTGYPLIYTRMTGTGLNLVPSAQFLLPRNVTYRTIPNEIFAWLQVGGGVWAMLGSSKGLVDDNTPIAGYGLIYATSLTRWTQKNIMPIGAEMFWPTTTPPAMWLLENGQAVSRTTYSELNTLFANAGYPYGNGDGSTTFNLDDMRGRFPVMLDGGQLRTTAASTIGAHGGTEIIGITHMPAHDHPQTQFTATQSGPGSTRRQYGGQLTLNLTASLSDSNVATQGGGAAFNPPFGTRNFIIYAGV